MAHSDLNNLLLDHPSLELIADNSKVRCNLTKHEMPATVEAVGSYVSGKKYKKVRSVKTYGYDKLKPHIVPSTKPKHTHEMFCTLTLRHIGKSPEAIERHINGKRYKRALARWQKCKETGEKFVPRVGRPKKVDVSDNDSMSGGEKFWGDDLDSNEESEDDMSDLFPVEDFEDKSEDVGGDNEVIGKENHDEGDDPLDSDYSMSEFDQDSSANKVKPSSSKTTESKLGKNDNVDKKKRLPNMQKDSSAQKVKPSSSESTESKLGKNDNVNKKKRLSNKQKDSTKKIKKKKLN
ncbi:Surfeit locus protein 2 [Bulinus truncatus]|nr:Surfeit locus protein 2 [Bulinus truncatus]